MSIQIVRLFLLSISALLLQACSSTPQVKSVPVFPAYKKLVIITPRLDTAVVSNMDEEDKKALEEIGPKLVKAFLQSCQERVTREKLFKEVVVDAEDVKDALVLSSEFTKLNAGHRGLRFVMTYLVWIPVGGKTEIEMEATLKDGNSGKIIDTDIDDADTAVKMTNFKDLFLDFSRELGEGFADFVEDYMRSPLNED